MILRSRDRKRVDALRERADAKAVTKDGLRNLALEINSRERVHADLLAVLRVVSFVKICASSVSGGHGRCLFVVSCLASASGGRRCREI
ncbi:hypothetical protein [Streptosporangium subroseum]|uniref:hypothetical protein n=1 Tax=Streptosporangium subroseum TaxID=106412 RepID=UPI00308FF7E1|nr:hypothetical protein OHB15_11685 [Streptosporangium subroseum]